MRIIDADAYAEKILNALIKAVTDYKDTDPKPIGIITKITADIIADLRDESATPTVGAKWTLCKDEQPKKVGFYWAYSGGGEYGDYYYTGCGKWYVDTSKYIEKGVIAWIPLPEEYKGEANQV